MSFTVPTTLSLFVLRLAYSFTRTLHCTMRLRVLKLQVCDGAFHVHISFKMRELAYGETKRAAVSFLLFCLKLFSYDWYSLFAFVSSPFHPLC